MIIDEVSSAGVQRDNLRGGGRTKPNKNADFPLPSRFSLCTLFPLPPPLSRIFADSRGLLLLLSAVVFCLTLFAAVPLVLRLRVSCYGVLFVSFGFFVWFGAV